MKKLISLLVVLCLALGMIPAFAEEDFLGEWYLAEIRIGEESYNAAMFGMNIVILLNEDGTAATVSAMPDEEDEESEEDAEPEVQEGTWEKTENGVVVTMEDETMEFILDEDLLISESDEGDMVFSREAPEAFVLPETVPAESEDAFLGVWVPKILVLDSVALPVTALGIEETITIEEGTMTILANTMPDEPQVYVLEFEDGSLAAVLEGLEEITENDVMVIELAEDGGLIMSSVLGDIVTMTYCVPAEEAAE